MYMEVKETIHKFFSSSNAAATQKLHFPVLCRILSFNFQDFSGPNWFSRIFYGLENPGKNATLSRMRGNPGHNNPVLHVNSFIQADIRKLVVPNFTWETQQDRFTCQVSGSKPQATEITQKLNTRN